MKKLTTISLFLFWMIATAILAAGLVKYEKSKTNTGATNQTNNQPTINSQQSNPPGTSPSTTARINLTVEELTKHNSAQSCWLLISSKIYDVTNFLSLHPGETGTILPSCGKEATQAYDTKNTGKPHSSSADFMLADYYIGDLNQTINQAQTSPPTSNPASSGSKLNRLQTEDEDEDD